MPHAHELTKQRLVHDRRQLLAIIRDCRNGRASHLPQTEREALLNNVRQRIAVVNHKLEVFAEDR